MAYLALWGVLVWAVVRRRRLPREDVLAYCILGGLSVYFVQNLFLFDTPATGTPVDDTGGLGGVARTDTESCSLA